MKERRPSFRQQIDFQAQQKHLTSFLRPDLHEESPEPQRPKRQQRGKRRQTMPANTFKIPDFATRQFPPAQAEEKFVEPLNVEVVLEPEPPVEEAEEEEEVYELKEEEEAVKKLRVVVKRLKGAVSTSKKQIVEADGQKQQLERRIAKTSIQISSVLPVFNRLLQKLVCLSDVKSLSLSSKSALKSLTSDMVDTCCGSTVPEADQPLLSQLQQLQASMEKWNVALSPKPAAVPLPDEATEPNPRSPRTSGSSLSKPASTEWLADIPEFQGRYADMQSRFATWVGKDESRSMTEITKPYNRMRCLEGVKNGELKRVTGDILDCLKHNRLDEGQLNHESRVDRMLQDGAEKVSKNAAIAITGGDPRLAKWFVALKAESLTKEEDLFISRPTKQKTVTVCSAAKHAASFKVGKKGSGLDEGVGEWIWGSRKERLSKTSDAPSGLAELLNLPSRSSTAKPFSEEIARVLRWESCEKEQRSSQDEELKETSAAIREGLEAPPEEGVQEEEEAPIQNIRERDPERLSIRTSQPLCPEDFRLRFGVLPPPPPPPSSIAPPVEALIGETAETGSVGSGGGAEQSREGSLVSHQSVGDAVEVAITATAVECQMEEFSESSTVVSAENPLYAASSAPSDAVGGKMAGQGGMAPVAGPRISLVQFNAPQGMTATTAVPAGHAVKDPPPVPAVKSASSAAKKVAAPPAIRKKRVSSVKPPLPGFASLTGLISPPPPKKKKGSREKADPLPEVAPPGVVPPPKKASSRRRTSVVDLMAHGVPVVPPPPKKSGSRKSKVPDGVEAEAKPRRKAKKSLMSVAGAVTAVKRRKKRKKKTRKRSTMADADDSIQKFSISLKCSNLFTRRQAPNWMILLDQCDRNSSDTDEELNWQETFRTEVVKGTSEPVFLTAGLVIHVLGRETMLRARVFMVGDLSVVDGSVEKLKLLGCGFINLEELVSTADLCKTVELVPSDRTKKKPNAGFFGSVTLQAVPSKLSRPVKSTPACMVAEFMFRSTIQEVVRVEETLIESPFALTTPALMFDLYAARDNAIMGSLNEKAMTGVINEAGKQFLDLVQKSRAFTEQHRRYLEGTITSGFRSSVDKKVIHLQMLPTNCHEHRLDIESNSKSASLSIVSVGACACHEMGYKHGGLIRLEETVLQMLEAKQTKDTAKNLPLLVEEIGKRRDVLMSQAVAVLLTSFHAVMQQHSTKKDAKWWRLMEHSGFLLQVESLLSTKGDELGMIEDYCKAITLLSNSAFQVLVERPPDWKPRQKLRLSAFHGLTDEATETPCDLPCCMEDVNIERDWLGEGRQLLVQVVLDNDFPVSILPRSLLEGGKIWVKPVFITQGINEQQTLANAVGRNKLQDRINEENIKKLREYAETVTDDLIDSPLDMIQGLLAKLEDAFINPKHEKNFELLLISETITRRLCGGRVTSCKSAKDRTSMAITLEHALLLRDEFDLMPNCLESILLSLRSRGVRRDNVQKNIGSRQYAFNKFQRANLPKLYRPPDGCGGGIIT